MILKDITQHDLIHAIKQSSSLSKVNAAKCVDLLFGKIVDALPKGDRVDR